MLRRLAGREVGGVVDEKIDSFDLAKVVTQWRYGLLGPCSVIASSVFILNLPFKRQQTHFPLGQSQALSGFAQRHLLGALLVCLQRAYCHREFNHKQRT